MSVKLATLAAGLRSLAMALSRERHTTMTSIPLILTPRQSYHISVTGVAPDGGKAIIKTTVITCYCTVPCVQRAIESERCPTALRTGVSSALISAKDGIGVMNLTPQNEP